MSKSSIVIGLCRTLLRELKKSNTEVRCNQLWKHVVSEVRCNTSSKGTVEQRMALLKEYVIYLKNSRRHQELLAHYQGRSERSVEESAKLVGLKIPKNTF